MFSGSTKISLFFLTTCLGILLGLMRTSFADKILMSTVAHNLTVIVIAITLFVCCFFSYVNFFNGKDVRWYFLDLTFYLFGFVGAVPGVCSSFSEYQQPYLGWIYV